MDEGVGDGGVGWRSLWVSARGSTCYPKSEQAGFETQPAPLGGRLALSCALQQGRYLLTIQVQNRCAHQAQYDCQSCRFFEDKDIR